MSLWVFGVSAGAVVLLTNKRDVMRGNDRQGVVRTASHDAHLGSNVTSEGGQRVTHFVGHYLKNKMLGRRVRDLDKTRRRCMAAVSILSEAAL